MSSDPQEARVNKVGKWFGTITWVWLCSSVVLLLLIVIAALVAR